MKDFRKLKVWQQGIDLVTKIYTLSKKLPKEERYGLYSQVTRAAVSIPSNIAEGSSRSSDKDFIRFLEIALGSSYEVETQLIIIINLNYLTKESIKEILIQLNSIQKMIQGLIKALKKAKV